MIYLQLIWEFFKPAFFGRRRSGDAALSQGHFAQIPLVYTKRPVGHDRGFRIDAWADRHQYRDLRRFPCRGAGGLCHRNLLARFPFRGHHHPDLARPDQVSRFRACQGCLLRPAPCLRRIDFRRYAGGICRLAFSYRALEGRRQPACVIKFPCDRLFPGAIAVYLEIPQAPSHSIHFCRGHRRHPLSVLIKNGGNPIVSAVFYSTIIKPER